MYLLGGKKKKKPLVKTILYLKNKENVKILHWSSGKNIRIGCVWECLPLSSRANGVCGLKTVQC